MPSISEVKGLTYRQVLAEMLHLVYSLNSDEIYNYNLWIVANLRWQIYGLLQCKEGIFYNHIIEDGSLHLKDTYLVNNILVTVLYIYII